ncbi:MAG: hypothetical protein A2W03_17470 [Candidatus Aminicenantes bacterium RBG_16_63_16]|nr:MAG: hypothetical protein A2W03_17470 [Candidatus Aminicenantes bacterium RBG_16_63_16]
MKPLDHPKGEPGGAYPGRLYLALAALAVFSCLGLDFLAARRGDQAYLFPRREAGEARRPAPPSLAELAGRVFTEAGLAGRDVRSGLDQGGQPRYSIELAEEDYFKLAPRLRSIFQENEAGAQVDAGASEGRTTYSWHVQRGDREKLTLLFSCLPPRRPEAGQPSAPSPPPPPPSAKIAAIIIDDMGNSLEALQELFDLGIPLTISVLPQSPYALETAQAAHDRQLEVMLHLPGESLNHQEEEAPLSAIIRSDMGPDEIRALVVDSLNRVPFVSGVNNHMGSKITQDRATMTPILDVLKERRLFFIDSVTGNRSIAYDQARKMGLRSAYRHVFLDSEVGADYSRKRLVELFKLAKKKGRAVAIGHPFPETLQALRDSLSLSRRYGVQLVLASQVVPD